MQYADIDDGFSHGGVPRFYRGALRGLRRAVAAWREQQVEFAIHLGDIIDGCARAIETVWFLFARILRCRLAIHGAALMPGRATSHGACQLVGHDSSSACALRNTGHWPENVPCWSAAAICTLQPAVIIFVAIAVDLNDMYSGQDRSQCRASKAGILPAFFTSRPSSLPWPMLECRKARTHSVAAITSVLDEFAGLNRRVLHIIGNHCLYNLPRQELNERLGGFWARLRHGCIIDHRLIAHAGHLTATHMT